MDGVVFYRCLRYRKLILRWLGKQETRELSEARRNLRGGVGSVIKGKAYGSSSRIEADSYSAG